MSPELIAVTMKYLKPSKRAKPRGYYHRLEHWKGCVEELGKSIQLVHKEFSLDEWYITCGYYED